MLNNIIKHNHVKFGHTLLEIKKTSFEVLKFVGADDDSELQLIYKFIARKVVELEDDFYYI